MSQQAWKGWKAFILFNKSGGSSYDEVGYSESVTVDIATGLEPFYQHGSRRPVDELVEGNEEITGSISRAWVDNDLLNLLTDDGSTGVTEWALYCYIDDTAGPWMDIYNLKLESGSFDIPQDGFIMNDIDFRATHLVYGTRLPP